jgi:hypothetical protein
MKFVAPHWMKEDCMRLKLGILAGIALLAMAGTAQAATVTLGGQLWTVGGDTLTLSPVVPGGNQPLNIQCVICGDHQPQQQADFGYTNYKNSGNVSDIVYFSSNIIGGGDPGADTVGVGYDGSFLRAYLLAVGDTSLKFSIGIDVNDTNSPQTLESFYLLNLTTHTVLASFSPEPGGTLLVNANNGTGFPDWTLSGFDINIGTDVHLGDQLIFFARLSGQNDGPDSFFIIAQGVAETPLPAAVWLFGGVLGVAGMIAGGRRRKQKTAWDVTKTA